MKPRIMLSGGGTGGSVTPLLAVADHLRLSGAEVLFVGTPNGPEMTLVDAANIPWQSIPAGKLRRYASWQNLRDVARVWAGYRAARDLVREWRPHVVVSAGSFVSVPLVWAAKRQGVRSLIHQQDVQPGLANRLMAPVANVVTVNFEISRKFFPADKVKVVGNPVRPSIFSGQVDRARQIFGLDPACPVLLVIGGGTGSAALNQSVADALPALRTTWEIIHVTGHHRGPTITSQQRYHPVAFMADDLPDALAAAEIVVSRAGLGVLTELMALRKPSIIIPMPDTHQVANAQYVLDQQAAMVILQSPSLADELVAAVAALHHDPAQRKFLSEKIGGLYRPDAASDIAQEILRLAHV